MGSDGTDRKTSPAIPANVILRDAAALAERFGISLLAYVIGTAAFTASLYYFAHVSLSHNEAYSTPFYWDLSWSQVELAEIAIASTIYPIFDGMLFILLLTRLKLIASFDLMMLVRYFIIWWFLGVCVPLGVLLLVIPGLILGAKWCISGPIAIVENRAVGGALRLSWLSIDRAQIGAVIRCYLIGFLILAAAYALPEMLYLDLEDRANFSYLASVEIGSSVGGVVLALIAIAIYRRLRGSGQLDAEVFA